MQLFGGKLPVISDRIGGGALVKALRLVGALGLFGGAALPIGGARDRQRRLSDRRCACEMTGGALGVVKEAQGDPAGVKFRVDPRGDRDGGMVGAERLGVFVAAAVEQAARHHPPLLPPAVAIDEGGAARRILDQQGGFQHAIGAA